jgi:hypothetical protein
MTVHVAQDSRAECFSYVAHSPILDISAGSSSVGICLAGDQITDEAVAFARGLAEAARVFAAEVERLHTMESRYRDQADQAA